MVISEGVNILFRCAKWTYLLGIHTPPVRDVSYIFHWGCEEFKWSCPITFPDIQIILHNKILCLKDLSFLSCKNTLYIKPKEKNSLSQLPTRIAFKNPHLPHFFLKVFKRFSFFFHLFFPTNGKEKFENVREKKNSGRKMQ